MPKFDGTGPNGKGQETGGGRGSCRQSEKQDRGQKGGRGQGRCAGKGGGRGMGRNQQGAAVAPASEEKDPVEREGGQ